MVTRKVEMVAERQALAPLLETLCTAGPTVASSLHAAADCQKSVALSDQVCVIVKSLGTATALPQQPTQHLERFRNSQQFWALKLLALNAGRTPTQFSNTDCRPR